MIRIKEEEEEKTQQLAQQQRQEIANMKNTLDQVTATLAAQTRTKTKSKRV